MPMVMLLMMINKVAFKNYSEVIVERTKEPL